MLVTLIPALNQRTGYVMFAKLIIIRKDVIKRPLILILVLNSTTSHTCVTSCLRIGCTIGFYLCIPATTAHIQSIGQSFKNLEVKEKIHQVITALSGRCFFLQVNQRIPILLQSGGMHIKVTFSIINRA